MVLSKRLIELKVTCDVFFAVIVLGVAGMVCRDNSLVIVSEGRADRREIETLVGEVLSGAVVGVVGWMLTRRVESPGCVL